MKTFDQIREGYASAAQRKAIWANKADGGKGHPDNKKEDSSDAVKAFLAKGGKIKKLPPGKAQGYHGKDDPGKDVAGIMDRPDTKQIGTRKKVKSMESTKVDEISKDTKKSYIKKAVNDVDNRSYAQGTVDATNKNYNGKNNKKIANRRAGINRALEAKETDPPFDNAKKISTTPTKDQFGNVIKNRAKNLARKAARNLANKTKNESSYNKLNKYNKDAQTSKDKATNSAVATILRKGDHSKDLDTMRKREKGLKMVKSRITDKIRKGHKANEGRVNELSPDTKKSYTKKATTDLYGRGLRKGMDIERGSSSLGRTKVVDKDNDRKISNRHAGIYRAQK